VRVVSLLPAGTEIVAALGAEHLLVGVSHECDYPPSARRLPRLTTTPIDVTSPGARIDAEVRSLRASGRPVIGVDQEQLRHLAPDLIITQDLCQVCAVSDGQVHQLASSLRPAPQVLSLSAQNLSGIWSDISLVGSALRRKKEAEDLLRGLRSRLGQLASSSPASPPRVLCIEWLDPLYLAGHWVPELVSAAGGHDVGAVAGARSLPSKWSHLPGLDPTCILVMLCGFDIERSRAELELLSDPLALDLMDRTPTWIMNGNAYTSRPGPRVVDGAVRMQSAFCHGSMPGIEPWTPTWSALIK
jgi:iron complex transport system substrate-binding protein